MDIDRVKESLDKNAFLTEDVKSNLFELTLVFNKRYPNVSLLKLAKRLETIKFEVVGKFMREDAIYYNEKTNMLQINETELEKTNNTKHILMEALLHMISKDERENHLPDAFRDGFAKLLANNLVGSEVE